MYSVRWLEFTGSEVLIESYASAKRVGSEPNHLSRGRTPADANGPDKGLDDGP